MINTSTYVEMATPAKLQDSRQQEMDSEDDLEVSNTTFEDYSITSSHVFSTPTTEMKPRGRPRKSVSSGGAAMSGRSRGGSSERVKKVRQRAASSSCITCMKAIEDEKGIQCKLCQGYICHGCSQIPEQVLTFMATGAVPYICPHCQRTGLPTLQKITTTLTEFQQKTTSKLNNLEKKTLRSMKECSDKQFTSLENKITDLEKSIDTKIDKKFEDKEQEFKKSIEDSVTLKIQSQIADMLDYDEIANKTAPRVDEIEKKVTSTLLGALDKMVTEKQIELETEAIEKKMTDILKDKIDKALTRDTDGDEEDNLSKLIKKLIDQKLEETKSTSATPSSSTIPIEQVSPRTYMKTTVVNVTSELKQKEKRMYNIIVYGLPDSTADTPDGQKKEDIKKFLNIVNNKLEIDAKEDDIKDAYRLNRNTTTDRSKPPPLLITVKQLTLKEDIFNNVRKLRGEKLSFVYDLTPLEREEHKRQVDLARQKTKNAWGGGESTE